MRTLLNAVRLIAVVAVMAPSLLAQWPDFKAAGVPRLPDGKPDLNAPTPRTADGHPDLSGLWENARGGGGGQRGAAAGAPAAGGRGAAPAPATPAPPAAPAPAAPAPAAAAPATPTGPPNATFFNIGAGFKEGLPFQPWAAELLKKRTADNAKDNPDAHCLPMGFMQFHLHPQPRKIIQTPGLVLIIYEANDGLRQVFTDGRPLPSNDPQPWWYGYSVGKWEGDTLVVTTKGFIDGIWLDVNGSPLTDQGTVTEKFRRKNFGNLEIEVTIDDPKAYTKPFTVKVDHRIMVDTELIEFICEDRDAIHYVGAKPQ